jgi:hypothetical protein
MPGINELWLLDKGQRAEGEDEEERLVHWKIMPAN